MFREQAMRLLREQWANVKMLAEELYTIFQTEGELTHKGTIVIEKDGDSPPFELRGFSSGDSMFSVKGSDGVSVGDIVFSGGGFSGSTTNVNQTTVQVSQTNVYLGYIVSGSGDTYTVRIYPDGPSGEYETVTATCLQIADGYNLPHNRYIPGPVYKFGNSYVFQWPTW